MGILVEALGAGLLLLMGAIVFPIVKDYIKEWIEGIRGSRSAIQQTLLDPPKRQEATSPENSAATDEKTTTAPEKTDKPQKERKLVEIVLNDLTIGWMETYFTEAYGKVRHGPVDAYMIPDAGFPQENEFIGYYDTLDKAHIAIEKAYLREQKKRRNRTKSQKRYH